MASVANGIDCVVAAEGHCLQPFEFQLSDSSRVHQSCLLHLGVEVPRMIIATQSVFCCRFADSQSINVGWWHADELCTVNADEATSAASCSTQRSHRGMFHPGRQRLVLSNDVELRLPAVY